MANLLKKTTLALLLVFLSFALLGSIFHFEPRSAQAIPVPFSRVVYAVTDRNHTLYGSNADYATAHDQENGTFYSSTIVAIGGQWSSSTYIIFRTYLYFDTSILPVGANVTSAILQIQINGDHSNTDFNLTIQNGQPDYPHRPLQAGDYYYDHYSGNGGMLDTTGISTTAYNITLTDPTWINTTGYTKLALRSDRDINSIAPTGEEYLFIYMSSYGYEWIPRLYLTYLSEGYQYNFYGAYDENGARQGAINTTYVSRTEPSRTFSLDGNYTIISEVQGNTTTFDIGNNVSRTYYLYQDFEEIFAFRPTEPYTFYYFTLTDYIGMKWGYLESYINVNGTYRVVERWDVKIANEIPFVFSFGRTYYLRLICDRGTWEYGAYVGGGQTTYRVVVSSDMFPSIPVTANGLSIAASRVNESWIQGYFNDTLDKTAWVNFTVYDYETGEIAFSGNSTAYPVTFNWYGAGDGADYYAIFTISHSILGTWQTAYLLPSSASPVGSDFLSDLRNAMLLLGDFPFDIAQIPAVFIIIAIGLAFSWYSAPLGMIIMYLCSAILAYLGWLAIGWGWLTPVGVLIFIWAMQEAKSREYP